MIEVTENVNRALDAALVDILSLELSSKTIAYIKDRKYNSVIYILLKFYAQDHATEENAKKILKELDTLTRQIFV